MIRAFTYYLRNLTPLVNWKYFLNAWGLPPRYAAVAEVHGCPACRQAWASTFAEGAERERAYEAIRLYEGALSLLQRLDISHRAYSRFGLFDAWSEGDDIILSLPGSETERPQRPAHLLRLPMLRQQHVAHAGDPYLCLSDFLRPRERFQKGDIASQIGIFCCTVHRTDGQVDEPADDYQRLLYQTVCDRLVEAASEELHAEIRRSLWGFAPDEALSPADMWAGRFQSIRPAVGYPALPDHSLIFLLDKALRFDRAGIRLTESGMMWPHSSVAALVFAHPQARYFGVGRISEEQLHDYARRRGLPAQELRKYLVKNLE